MTYGASSDNLTGCNYKVTIKMSELGRARPSAQGLQPALNTHHVLFITHSH